MSRLLILLSCLSLAISTIVIPTITITAGLGTTLAGLGLLKLATAAVLARSKRQVGNSLDRSTILFQAVTKLEEAKCVRRFLCEAATGSLQAPEFNPSIQALYSDTVNQVLQSAKFPYTQAVKDGARHGNVLKCQAAYSCPKTGAEIYNALALTGA